MKYLTSINMLFKMRKLIITIIFISYSQSNAQRVIYDRSIVHQYKRMVYESWGNFHPEPVWKRNLWGIGWKQQKSMNAALMWGYTYRDIPLGALSEALGVTNPKRNRRYRDGKDIRPLKATGLQNLRYIERNVQREQTKKIFKEAEDIKQKALRDMAHNTSLTVETDLLWQWYYKKKLKPLKQFPKNPSDYMQWGFSSQEVFQKINDVGGVKVLQEKLDLLKHDYNISQKVDMPRGKRMLLYHKCLMDWRKFKQIINSYNINVEQVINIENKIEKSKNPILNTKVNTDLKIVNDIMNKYKHKF